MLVVLQGEIHPTLFPLDVLVAVPHRVQLLGQGGAETRAA